MYEGAAKETSSFWSAPTGDFRIFSADKETWKG